MNELKQDSFEHLYVRYYTMCYRFILSKVRDPWTAEDLLSEVFIKIYKHKNEINDIDRSGHWIIKIASNTIIDFYRKNKIIELNKEITSEEVYEENYEKIFIKDEFIAVTKNLPDDMKKILNMRFLNELKFKEIGRMMNYSETIAKKRVYKALKIAKEMYNCYLKEA